MTEMIVFWKNYDLFMASAPGPDREKFIVIMKSIILRLFRGMADLEKLSRPEKGWVKPIAWVVIAPQTFLTIFENSSCRLTTGDLIVRDSVCTHFPIRKQTGACSRVTHGTIVPLYTQDQIAIFVNEAILRITASTQLAAGVVYPIEVVNGQ